MSVDQVNAYVNSNLTKSEQISEHNSEYDSDLNKTAYQEFWQDLRAIKKEATRNKSSIGTHTYA